MMPSPQILKNISLIASDIDDTLTVQGKFHLPVLESIQRLSTIGVHVLLATGRPSGWAMALAQYIPGLCGVIAENGGTFCGPDFCRIVSPHSVPSRERLEKAVAKIQCELPEIKIAPDSFSRLTDIAIRKTNRSPKDMALISDVAFSFGLSVIESSIQIHLHGLGISKGQTLTVVASEKEIKDPNQILTIGDSSNDETMFDPEVSKVTCAVSNISPYLERMRYKPKYIIEREGGYGAAELFQTLISAKSL